MLVAPDILVRQAAAFGLGELGGPASTRLLEQQLVLEETRGDADGASVAEAITQALGRIKEVSARAPLVRRLRHLTVRKADLAEVNAVARALWRKRHPELLAAVRKALEQRPLPSPNALHGLLVLLEKSPQELRQWAHEPSVPVEHKTAVLTVLEEEVPDAWTSTLPAFISTAHALLTPAVSQDGEAANFCERLFILLMLHQEQLLATLAEEACAQLRTVARRLVSARSLNCSFQAALLLRFVGKPEDVAILEAHRPEDPVGARAFDEVAQTLRRLQAR
jgi:hypothetical protein